MSTARRRRALNSAPSTGDAKPKSTRDSREHENVQPESQTRNVVERNEPLAARYGIEIRGLSIHAEVDDAVHIDAVLNGYTGQAAVFDRENRTLLFEGTVEEVRKALGIHNAPRIDNMSAEPEQT